MKKVKLGNTGLEASKLGFGAMHLPRISGEESEKLVNAAIDMGINYIDTARAYQDSEEKLSRVIPKRRDEVILTSRAFSWKQGADKFIEDLETSLKTIKVDYFDFYGFHSVNKLEELDLIMSKHLELLQKAKEEGKVKHLLITGHNHLTMAEAAKKGVFEMIFFPFNVIEQEPLEKLIPAIQENKIASTIMKPLAGGMIEETDLALRFFESHPVDVIVVGMSKMTELVENFRTISERKELTDEELEKLEKSVEALGKDFCRRCAYCQPCPQNIMIPFVHMIYQKCYGRELNDDVSYTLQMGQRLLPSLKQCVECGQCEEKCPYELPTKERIKAIIDMLEGTSATPPSSV